MIPALMKVKTDLQFVAEDVAVAIGAEFPEKSDDYILVQTRRFQNFCSGFRRLARAGRLPENLLKLIGLHKPATYAAFMATLGRETKVKTDAFDQIMEEDSELEFDQLMQEDSEHGTHVWVSYLEGRGRKFSEKTVKTMVSNKSRNTKVSHKSLKTRVVYKSVKRRSLTNLSKPRSLTNLSKRRSLNNLSKRRSLKNLSTRRSLRNLSKQRSFKNLSKRRSLKNLSKRRSLENLSTNGSPNVRREPGGNFVKNAMVL